MQLSANNEITPIKKAENAWQQFLDTVGPWAAVGAIAYLIFKGGRYGA